MGMGFNKCILLGVDKMKELIDRNGIEHLKTLYGKCDCLIGSSESIEFLNNIMQNDSRAPEPGKIDGRLPGWEK